MSNNYLIENEDPRHVANGIKILLAIIAVLFLWWFFEDGAKDIVEKFIAPEEIPDDNSSNVAATWIAILSAFIFYFIEYLLVRRFQVWNANGGMRKLRNKVKNIFKNWS